MVSPLHVAGPVADLQPLSPASKRLCTSTPPCYVEHHLVDLIRWKEENGTIRELEIQSNRAQYWTQSAAKLGFELGGIKSTKENQYQYENEPNSVVAASENQGIENAPDSSNYPKSQLELCNLLEDANLSEISKELSEIHRME